MIILGERMKKRGFTLIELLAVIVILAIIALIATPIILNMINNARKSAAKSSTYGYIEAIDSNNGFADAEVEGYTKIVDGTYEVSEISVRMKGKAPEGGEVTITQGKVTNADICMNGYNVTYQSGQEAQVGNKCVPLKNITTSNFGSDSITWEDIRNLYVHDSDSLDAIMAAKTTKNVTITGLGTHPVRIINTTPCSEVSVTSKTSCGLVLEFADLLTTARFNTSNTNIGGWPGSSIYSTYFASTGSEYLYNKLPSDLKSVIIDTTVISGHGSGETNAFTSTDKLFLLSTKEMNISGSDSNDGDTRVLDYYTGAGNGTRSKSYDGSTRNQWTRTVRGDTIGCHYLTPSGSRDWNRCDSGSSGNYYFSAAFRLSN